MATTAILRRQVLKGTGALVVSFSLLGSLARALGQTAAPAPSEPDPTNLDSWLAVAQNGTVTVFTSKVDLGTGVVTALAQIVAEELDVPFASIHMDVGDTSKTIDQGITSASRTIERGGPQLRQAAAAARQELLKLASARLQAPAEQLTIADGVVSVAGNPANSISYGNLIGNKRFNVKVTATGVGWDMKVAPEVRSKDPNHYKIVGTSVPRLDLPGKFTGEFVYSQDMRVSEMLHGRVVRPSAVMAKPSNIDESSISHIAGARVVKDGDFVGVVAPTEWAAIQAARTLNVTWSTPATRLPANPEEVYEYLKNTKSFRDLVPANKGNLDAGFAQAAKIFEATYHWPFQNHGMLGPSCAVADVRGDKATIWTGTQGPFRTRKAIADLLNLPEKSVLLLYREGSGSYGRLECDDVAEDAALISRAVGKPVRVQWMREDEHGWEPKGPAQYTTVRAGIDAKGNIVAWDFMDRSFPWTETVGNPLLASRQIGLKPTDPGFMNGVAGGGQIYAMENQKVVAAQIPWVQPDPIPLRTSNLRAPGDLARTFASETMIDQIASAVGVDPVQYRLRCLTQNKRATEVLLAATRKAGWKERPSPAPASSGAMAIGRGVAICDRANTMVAAVAEVEINKSAGKVLVKRITLAHDCGLIVNPDGIKNQIEGNIIQGVSRALMEVVKWDASGIQSLDWRSYPIIRFKEVPDIEIVLINHPEMQPLGGGEGSTVPITAAIANAIFDAVGAKLREVPFTPERVLAAMKA
jgi:nicotinate dehydrogenase subunit B